MHDIFISYSTKDRQQAYEIRSFLTGKGISCWMAPESIPTGSNYTKEIPMAIRNCKVFLLILSENAQQSPWVLRELDGAVNNNRYILPYLLDDKPMEDEFQFLLTGCQWHPSWQENALEGLAARILALLPPPVKEAPVTGTPVSVPEPVVPPAAETVVPPPEEETPVATGFVCPACGSRNWEARKNDKLSYSVKEKLFLLLSVPAALASLPFADALFTYLLKILDIHALYYYGFEPLGLWVKSILTVAGVIAVGILCYRGIRSRIRHNRMKKGFRANGMRCLDCRKGFRVQIPTMTRFPWEEPLEPASPLPNVATIRCPACGTRDISLRKNGAGSYTRKESARFLLAWLAGLICWFPLCYLLAFPLRFIDYFVEYRSKYFLSFTDLGEFTLSLAAFLLMLGVVALVKKPIREWIRRSRVRTHVHSAGCHCPHCRVNFRVSVPDTYLFPWDAPQIPTDHLRTGK